jgi:methyl-accepting chemotaxis protein
MTQSIIGSTHGAVAEMKEVVSMVKAGALLAEQAGTAIVSINGGSLRVLNGVKAISSSIQEQSLSGRKIAVNVEKVAQASEESSTSVQEISSTVEKLEHLSQTLEESVKHFRV